MLPFILLCSLWYFSSALSSNTGKAILTRFPFPVTLTIIQFIFGALWSALCLILRNHNHPTTKKQHVPLGIRIPNQSTLRATCIMSLFSIAGHVFSSMAISRVPVSTVHTIKALSPLFTVIAYAGLFGVRYGFYTYLSLLPLTLGVMLACSFDMRANGVGFLCALGSTIIFVSQNIFGKKILPKDSSTSTTKGHHHTPQMDKLNLLFYSSAIAFLMMIPIWIYMDLAALWTLPSSNTTPTTHHATLGLASYFVINGTVHFGQCILAFSILSRTSPVTYSIASLIKRIAVICIAIVWFGQHVSLLQGFGMVLTFVGLYIYNLSKAEIEQGEKRRGILQHRQEVLLPSSAADMEPLPEEQEAILLAKNQFSPLHHHHPSEQQQIQFDNPFRHETLPHSSVQLLAKNQPPSNSSSARHHHHYPSSSSTTRQRAPSFPTPAPSSFIIPNDNLLVHHHHPLPHFHPPFLPNISSSSYNNKNTPDPPPPIKSSLQEPNSFRPIVNKDVFFFSRHLGEMQFTHTAAGDVGLRSRPPTN
ncbi:uncharacterized protein VP01_2670g4 [Puccinia sorghi]|uniref:Sugar phosphate transporter domain-containing protein n=1 Tax=Puccinia sorghi TaxID=27349 RepID=A0A0L6V3W3_9BASI|nr:uncharacterized protein VP01_2670g4 [Puccinia sorghi]